MGWKNLLTFHTKYIGSYYYYGGMQAISHLETSISGSSSFEAGADGEVSITL